MKKTALIPIIIALIANSNLVKAQSDTTDKQFKLDLALGLGNTAAIELEPHYRFSDAFAVGLRLQPALGIGVRQHQTQLL